MEDLAVAFVVVIIAIAIGIIAGAGIAFKFLAVVIPIIYFILNIGFIAEQYSNFEFLGSAAGLELPDINEISGLFAILGAALEIVFSFFIYSSIIAVILVIDYLSSILELSLASISVSIVINHVVCLIFSIIWAVLFFKFIY